MYLVGVMHMDSWGFYDTDSPPWIGLTFGFTPNILAFIFVIQRTMVAWLGLSTVLENP